MHYMVQEEFKQVERDKLGAADIAQSESSRYKIKLRVVVQA